MLKKKSCQKKDGEGANEGGKKCLRITISDAPDHPKPAKRIPTQALPKNDHQSPRKIFELNDILRK